MKLCDHINMLEMSADAAAFTPAFDIHLCFEAIHCVWELQALKRNTHIHTHIDRRIPPAFNLDSFKIQHCLNNLVSNAINHTKDGIIALVASTIERRDGTSWLVLSVKDTGAGIEAELMDSLFEINETWEEQTQQYGFIDTGLPMTGKLIGELGGHIKVKSVMGQGSVFALVLPLNRDMYVCDEDRPQRPEHIFNTLHLLSVDDYNLNQLTIKTILHDCGVKIHSATHGYEALEILGASPIDLVLMDIHMPVLDGIETTLIIRESKESWANIPIYALTADPHYQQQEICRKIGMNGTLAKPLRKQNLLTLLQDHQSEQKYAACV